MKNKKKLNTIDNLIDALKVAKEKVGGDAEVKVWDANCQDCYDYDEALDVVNMIIKNDFYFVENDDEDNQSYVVLKAM